MFGGWEGDEDGQRKRIERGRWWDEVLMAWSAWQTRDAKISATTSNQSISAYVADTPV